MTRWAGLDFGWMKELLAYDTPSVAADGPLRNGDEVPYNDARLPDFTHLKLWSKRLTAEALMKRLAALLPPPRKHLTTGPNSKLRPLVVRAPPMDVSTPELLRERRSRLSGPWAP